MPIYKPAKSPKEELEGFSNLTFGIEIEFGTHDCHLLTMTHIEICEIYADPGTNTTDLAKAKKNSWKLETDSNFTLELVSPILYFTGQEQARGFKDELMGFIQEKIQSGILLSKLMTPAPGADSLPNFIASKVKYDPTTDHWVPKLNTDTAQTPGVVWIGRDQMLEDINWRNYDDDIDLERVLAMARQVNESPDDTYIRSVLNNTLMTPSRKHGGLPSSQMNVPLSLENYVRYDLVYKRYKAWSRLLMEYEGADRKVAYKDKTLNRILDVYPHLDQDESWHAKHDSMDYFDSYIDAKIPIWHRYWLWLETFTQATGILLEDDPNAALTEYKEQIGDLITPEPENSGFADLPNFSEFQAELAAFYVKAKERERSPSACLTYITLQKLCSGSLAVLSEPNQAEAQQMVMLMDANMSFSAVSASVPHSEFMQFHYALKDLTPMWFKGALIDVLVAEDCLNDYKILLRKIAPNLVKVIRHVFTANLQLLGWYHSLAAATNQPFPYDWAEWRAYNMPSLDTFSKQLGVGLQELSTALTKSTTWVARYTDDIEPEFLQRTYEIDSTECKVAPWEGRWDTIKPVIEGNPMRYLVEHRNN